MIEKFFYWIDDLSTELAYGKGARAVIVDVVVSTLVAVGILSFVLGGCAVLEMILDKIF